MKKNSFSRFEKHKIYLIWLYHGIVIMCIVILFFNYIFKNDKLAYIDSSKIISEYKGSEDAKKEYQSKAKIWRANIDTLTNSVKQAIQKYEKSLATMSTKEQGMAKDLITIKQKQLSDYQKAIQANAKDEDAKLTQVIVSEVNAFLLKYGRTHNYKLILIANQSGTIAYARDGLEITSDVIEELNAQYIHSR